MKRKLFNFKNTFIVVCFFVFTSTAFASHFRYGDISYRVDPNDPTGKTIIFKANTAWRAGWTSSVDLPISIQGGQTNIGTIPQSLVSTSNGVKYYTGELSYTFQNTGIHTVYYGDCCKISNLQNNTGTSWYVFTTIDVGSNNNSPVTSLPALTNVQQNTNATFNIPAVDSDGDNLTYRLATTQDGLDRRFTQPQGFSVSSNGVATFNTNGKNIGGLYNAAVVIADSKGAEILVDFIMEIVEQSNPPQWDYNNTPVDGFTYQTSPTKQVSFTIKASDPDPGSSVSMSASGMPTGANISPDFDTNGNPIEHTFTWTPTSNQFGQYLINFTAKDNNNVTSSTSVSINVSLKPVFDVPPTPVSGAHNIIVSPGDLIEYTVQASDPDPNDVVQIVNVEGKDMMGNKIPLYNGASFSSLPTQAANPTSGVFSWTPTQQQWGHRHVFFTARDSYGEETIHEVSQLVNTPPSFISNPILNVFVDDAYSYSINISDPDLPFGDEVSIYGINLPNWLTLTDNEDGTALLTGTPSANDEGTFNIRIKAEDKNHHMDTRGVIYQDIILTVILDNTPPVLTLTGDNPQITELGNTYTELGATATDNVDDNTTLSQNISIDASDVNASTVGSYSVTYDVSDAAGNAATQVTRSVIVEDTTPPTLVTQDITVQLDANGNASITPQDVDNGSNDASGIASLSVSPNTFNCSNVGSGACSSHALAFTGPVNTGININPSNYDKFTFEAWIYPTRVNYGARQAIFSHDDCCYDRGLVIENGSSDFLVAAGNQTWYPASVDYNQWQHVAVVYDNSAQTVKFYKNGVEYVFQGNTNFSDSSKPMWLGGNPSYSENWQGRMDDVRVWNVARSASEINDNSASCINLNTSGLIHYYDFEEGTGNSAADKVGSNDLSLSNTTWVSGTPNLAGNSGTTVTLTATDSAGNTATATATVTVEDNIDPTISVTGDASVTHEALTPYTDLGATIADNCSATLTVTNNVDENTLGTYTVTYTATDSSGNETTATRTVEVVDTTIPVITLTGDNPQIVDLYTTYTELGATANDNYDGDITNDIVIDATAVDLTTVNCYPVTYNVIDASSNAATTVTRTVFVLEPGKPFAKDDASTVNKNSLGNLIYVLANDSYGTDGPNTDHPLTFSNGSSTNASLNGGHIEIHDNGTPNLSDDYITYSPANDFVGEDSFTYLITDSNGDAVSGEVILTVVEGNNDNRVPFAENDTAITSADSSITINVLGNDTPGAYGYIDNGLTATNGILKSGTEKGGEFEVNTNGTNTTDNDDITYTPKPGFFGTDTFSYAITDVNGNAATATVTITVNQVDLGYTEDVATVDQDSTDNIIDVMANDSDDAGYGSGDTRFLIQSQNHTTGTTEYGGTVALETYNNSDSADDVILYTPRAGFVGIDTFYYVPGSDRNASVLVTITVEAVVTEDDIPEAIDDALSVVQNGNSTVINVLDNDSYGDNGPNATHPLTFSDGTTISGTDKGGVLEITDNGTPDLSDDVVTYTPTPGFVGIDTFDYVITDADGDADTATVTITVTGSSTLNQPAAADDAETVNENATEFEIAVLSNDDPGSDGYIDNGLTATNGTQQGGTTEDGFFRINTKATDDTTDDVILYTPKAGFTGTDTFEYTITDASGDADTATVTITVEAVTDKPNAVDDTASTEQDTAVTIDVTGNDSYGTDNPATSNPVVVSSAPTNGTATVVGDDIEYTPAAGFVGTDTFTYTIEDSTQDTDTASVTVTVTPKANGVPTANDDTVASVDQNSVDNTINVLANDDYGTDGPNDDHQLTFSNGSTASASDQGGAIRVVNNTILYSPATDFVGEDKFTYVITDKNGDADAAEVTITVVSSGQASTPTAVDDSIAVDADSAETLVDVMANDTIGIDGYMDGGLTMPNGTLSSASTEDGLIRINNKGTPEVSDDEFFYMPKAGFTGTDTFKYTITDATGDASTATVTVTVASVVIPRSGNGDTSVSTTSSSFVTRNDFTAYPNPSTGYVKTTIFSTTNTEAEILLFDITGKVILRKQTSLTMGKNELELNLNVKPGIMLLRVQSPETNYGTTKIAFK